MLQEFVQEITNTIRENIRGVHTAFPGKIVSFDTSTGLATVQPVMKFKKPDGQTMDYPHITGVPVVIPQSMGQGAVIAFPIRSGDGCLVIVSEQSIDYWLYGKETATDLEFDLTNAICIPGLFQNIAGELAEACNSNAIILSSGGSKISIKSGVVEITAPSVQINGNLNVSGNVIGAGVSLPTHTHTGDSGGSTSAPK